MDQSEKEYDLSQPDFSKEIQNIVNKSPEKKSFRDLYKLKKAIENLKMLQNQLEIKESHQDLLKHFTIKSYKKNDILFKENQSSNYFYIILEGSVAFYQNFISNPQNLINDEKPVQILQQCEFFNHLQILYQIKAQFTAQVNTDDTQLIMIEKQPFLTIFGKFFQKFVHNFEVQFSNKNRCFVNLRFHSMLQMLSMMQNVQYLKGYSLFPEKQQQQQQQQKQNSSPKNKKNEYVYLIIEGEVVIQQGIDINMKYDSPEKQQEQQQKLFKRLSSKRMSSKRISGNYVPEGLAVPGQILGLEFLQQEEGQYSCKLYNMFVQSENCSLYKIPMEFFLKCIQLKYNTNSSLVEYYDYYVDQCYLSHKRLKTKNQENQGQNQNGDENQILSNRIKKNNSFYYLESLTPKASTTIGQKINNLSNNNSKVFRSENRKTTVRSPQKTLQELIHDIKNLAQDNQSLNQYLRDSKMYQIKQQQQNTRVKLPSIRQKGKSQSHKQLKLDSLNMLSGKESLNSISPQYSGRKLPLTERSFDISCLKNIEIPQKNIFSTNQQQQQVQKSGKSFREKLVLNRINEVNNDYDNTWTHQKITTNRTHLQKVI